VSATFMSVILLALKVKASLDDQVRIRRMV
jgi:hypothetical protein